jgi:hypothetical protein
MKEPTPEEIANKLKNDFENHNYEVVTRVQHGGQTFDHRKVKHTVWIEAVMIEDDDDMFGED